MTKFIIRLLSLVVLVLSLVWLYHTPGWEPAVMLVYAVTTILIEGKRRARIPKLDGRWEYEVVSANNRFSHKGKCDIAADETSLRIDGVRLFSSLSEGGRFVCREVNTEWHSEWAQVCNDDHIRFVYAIALPDPIHEGRVIRGMCTLRYGSTRPSELSGAFHVLPPFEKDAMFCNWGSITLRRLGKDEAVTPPKEYDSTLPPSSGTPESELKVPAYHGDQGLLSME